MYLECRRTARGVELHLTGAWRVTHLDALTREATADRDLLQAELDLRQITLNELLSVVQLYKALGGGWQ